MRRILVFRQDVVTRLVWGGLLTIAAVSAARIGNAQPASIQLRTEVGPREITIGDPIRYGITVVTSSSVVSLPVSTSAALGEFERLRYDVQRPNRLPDQRVEVRHELTLTTFSTGTLTIPPMPLLFRDATGEMAVAQTEPVSVTVKSLLEEKGDEGGLRPLKGLYNFPSFWWIWILAGLLVLGLLYFGWRAWRRSRPEAVAMRAPKRPAEMVAWEAIHRLEDSDLLEQGQVKEYYSRLSGLLRQYLEDRYAISALDRTTGELLQLFRTIQLTLEQASLAREFFENSDLVKFAKFTPDQDSVEDDLNRVKRFVTVTTPQPEQKKDEPIPV